MMDILDKIKEECGKNKTCYTCKLYHDENCIFWGDSEWSLIPPSSWETEKIRRLLEESVDEECEHFKNALKENDELFYKLVGVMHFVDKFLEEDELELNEVQRVELMGEKVLKGYEKQIPKKPKINHYEEKGEKPYTKICCPNGCNVQLYPVTEKHMAYEHAYCPKCGQAIDWSEE